MKNILRNIYEALLDLSRYLRATGQMQFYKGVDETHIESHIIRRYHVLEKTISMPNFKPRSSVGYVEQLIKFLEVVKHYPSLTKSEHISVAERVLYEYYKKHVELGINVDDIIPRSFRNLDKLEHYNSEWQGGVKKPTSPLLSDVEALRRIMLSRSSIRSFDLKRKVEVELIESVIDVAKKTPSVCNRQTWRVHCYGGDRAQEVLRHQNGNTGFGYQVPHVLIVTVDMRYFVGAIERYQPWIDGGMFSMSLLLGLQSVGLGAVALNWSVLNRDDERMRGVAEIPEYERIIMLIGYGFPHQDALVPVSHRSATKNFIKVH